MVQSQQDNRWQFDKWGIIGISPKGSFLTYLRKLYFESDSISLALEHTLGTDNSFNHQSRYLVNAFLNPNQEDHYKISDILGTFIIPEDDDFWSIKGSVNLGDTSFSYEDEKICLSTIGDELFGVIDSLVWCNEVKKIVCDGDVKYCNKSKAKLEKSPIIKFKFENVEVSFTHKDYIFFENNELKCNIGDICSQRREGVCEKNTQVILGKLFYEKYTPVFNVDIKSGISSVSFIKNFKIKKIKIAGWIIFGSFIAIISLLILIFVIIKKRNPIIIEKDNDYQSISNTSEEEI